MARKREPFVPLLCSFPDSEKLNAVSEGAENLYLRLLARCDDQRNFYGSPPGLLAHLYALRWENGDIDVTETARRRDELVTVALVKLYRVRGRQYLHVIDAKKVLRKDIAADIRFPSPDETAPADETQTSQTLICQPRTESATESGRNRDGIGTESNHSNTAAGPVSALQIQTQGNAMQCNIKVKEPVTDPERATPPPTTPLPPRAGGFDIKISDAILNLILRSPDAAKQRAGALMLWTDRITARLKPRTDSERCTYDHAFQWLWDHSSGERFVAIIAELAALAARAHSRDNPRGWLITICKNDYGVQFPAAGTKREQTRQQHTTAATAAYA